MAGDTKGNEEVVLEDDQQSDLRTLAELLCFEEVPPKWTQDFDSLHSIGKFSPLFMPSFNEVETECMEVFEKKKMETKKILGNFDGQISLSVDILRCESYFDPSCCGDYLCLSAHFIDENWELKKWVLQFSCISVSVSGPSDDSLHKYEDWGILRTLEDWGIENKISALTLKNDNCNNELVEFVKRRIQENNGKLLRVYCCAEMISVMVQDAFDKIEDIAHKVRQSWSTKDVLGSNDVVPSPEEWKKVEVKDRNGNSQVAVVLGAIHKLFDEYVVRFPLQDYQQFIHLNDHSKEKSDLDCYLEQPVLRNGKNFNALAWWRIAGIEYPTLSRMARDFLAIPVSLASKIDAYYTVPKPADDHLVWLKPDLMNALMCTRSWYVSCKMI
ncbi:unnamed protein product [Prunus armeniaca]